MLTKYEIAKIIFTTVNTIRKLNDEKDIESFDDISEERKNQLLKNIDEILEHPEITAKDEHDIWMKLKLKDGWKYGEKTDRNNKIHNCLIPYENLNVYQQLKDEIAICIIRTLSNKGVDKIEKIN
jgi:hypothetical protein